MAHGKPRIWPEGTEIKKVLLRLPAEYRKRLNELAEESDISVNHLLVALIRKMFTAQALHGDKLGLDLIDELDKSW